MEVDRGWSLNRVRQSLPECPVYWGTEARAFKFTSTILSWQRRKEFRFTSLLLFGREFPRTISIKDFLILQMRKPRAHMAEFLVSSHTILNEKRNPALSASANWGASSYIVLLQIMVAGRQIATKDTLQKSGKKRNGDMRIMRRYFNEDLIIDLNTHYVCVYTYNTHTQTHTGSLHIQFFVCLFLSKRMDDI